MTLVKLKRLKKSSYVIPKNGGRGQLRRGQRPCWRLFLMILQPPGYCNGLGADLLDVV